MELLPRHYRCVWSGVVPMKHNSSLFRQSWAFLCDCFLETVELLTVQVRTKNLALVVHFKVVYCLTNPRSIQYNFPIHFPCSETVCAATLPSDHDGFCLMLLQVINFSSPVIFCLINRLILLAIQR